MDWVTGAEWSFIWLDSNPKWMANGMILIEPEKMSTDIQIGRVQFDLRLFHHFDDDNPIQFATQRLLPTIYQVFLH